MFDEVLVAARGGIRRRGLAAAAVAFCGAANVVEEDGTAEACEGILSLIFVEWSGDAYAGIE